MNADFGSFTQLNSFSTITFYVLICISVLAILIGVCGLSCLCRPCVVSRGWTVIFGLTILWIWITFSIFGFIITAISTNGPETMQAFCDGQITAVNL